MTPGNIYIPHWLDSMEVIDARDGEISLIYIPHWLDSMVTEVGHTVAGERIYIPHWLDSMCIIKWRVW